MDKQSEACGMLPCHYSFDILKALTLSFFKRNIDRILSLSSSNSSAGGLLSYKEHGLLLSEAHILRKTLLQVLPVQVSAEFLEDLNELTDLRTGVERQVRVVNRIRWAYAKWLQA